MTSRPYVLLPPSEGKSHGGTCVSGTDSFSSFLGVDRDTVITAVVRLLDTARPTEIERALGARGALLLRAESALRALGEGRAPTLPAWRRYTGVVWTHLDPASLSASARRRILVPSGLYGVTCATDRIADYRLKVVASIPPLGPLASYWRPRVSPVLVRLLAGATVVTLLPKDHERAIDLEALSKVCRLIRVSFIEESGQVMVGHDAKAVKGVLASRLLTEGVGALEEFAWRKWRAQGRSGEWRIVRRD